MAHYVVINGIFMLRTLVSTDMLCCEPSD